MMRVVTCVFLLFFAYKCSATLSDNGMIYIEFDGNATLKNTTLIHKRPFTIVIKETSNKIHNISNIKCHFAKNIYQDFTKNLNGIWDQKKQTYTVQQGNAMKAMNASWHCDITYYITSTTMKHCNFATEIAVKNSAFVLYSKVFVNDVLVQTTQKDIAEGTYESFKGEIAKVTCQLFRASYISMSYYDGDRLYNIPTSTFKSLTMYLKIRKRQSAYVQCHVIQTPNKGQEQSIRLEFKKKKPREDLPTFNVNGLTLVPTLAGSGDHYSLVYEYFEGEFINLTASNAQGWKNSGELEKVKLNGDKLFYSGYVKYKNVKFTATDTESKPIILYLRPVSNNLSVIVSGLPFSQTNVKYLYNSKTYRTVFFNENNNILNLTCSMPTGNTTCKWDQNLPLTNDTSKKSVLFLPQKHTNQSTVIACQCANYIHEVTILRDDDKRPKPYTRPHDEEKTKTSDVAKKEKNNLVLNVPKNDTDGNYDFTLVVIIVVALIVVAAVVWLMVGLYKRRQRREKAMQSEFNYESLENTTERTMPPPAQWDNYSQPVDKQNENDTLTYSVPYQERNVEDMYAKPQPKSLRKPPNESMYNEPSYATVDQLGEKPTYGNLSNQTAGYSQIQPKKLIGNPNAPKVLPTESPYAEVLPKSLRPNKESSKYANVFENQRYVNSDNEKSGRDTSEYAEPAYCEIGSKNK